MALNQEQESIRRDAVNWFKHSSKQVFEFEGPAGTGKTYLTWEILKSLGLDINEYMAMAYTGQASIVMRTRGFSTARSIHSSLYEVIEVEGNANVSEVFGVPLTHMEFRKKLMIDPHVKLLFIDEGWMVPKRMVEDILSFGVKVLVCGDHRQLPPINSEPGFLTGSNVRHLTQLMRQAENDPIVYLAQRAINGLPIHSGSYGNVIVIEDKDLVPQYFGYADTVICGTNKTRETVNNYVRQLAGFTTPTPNFGERIICRNNNWNVAVDGVALANGLTGTVISQLTPERFDGYKFSIDFKPDLINGAFYDVPVNYEYFIAPYQEKANLKEKNRKWIQGELFEFAYAISCWLAQGSEYNNGIYIEEFMRPQIQRQLNYTGITRFKNSMIYVKKTNKYFSMKGEK